MNQALYPVQTMIHIEKVETHLLDIPTVRPHVLSMATMKTQTILLLRLFLSDGVIGVGEATTIGGLSYGPESPEGMRLALERYVAPLILNRPFRSPAHLMSEVRRQIVGNHFVLCALETALLDGMGKRLGVPIASLIGGAIHSALPVGWVLASGDPKKDIDEAEMMLAQKRHNIFKIKIGKRTVADDVKHVAAIKAALGDRASIRVDVNQAWSRTEAKRGCAALKDAGVDLVEQPLHREDLDGAAALKMGRTPVIMADETLNGPQSGYRLASERACDVISLKIAPSGGLQKAAETAHIGLAAGLELYGGTMLESSVGTAASAHLFATLPALKWGTELFAPLLLTENIIQSALRYSNYELMLPEGPGLGLELDLEKVKFFERDA
ncbi:MAG: muconate/chloromuconate family cycloisomerase [Chloroflexota bacterium]